MKYKHTVAMKVTREQFESLKPALKAMERQINIWGSFESYPFLTATNDDGLVGNYDSVKKTTILVNDYNPELFLALAAMTDNEEGNVGEYWKCINGDGWFEYFTNNKLYSQTECEKSHLGLISDKGKIISIKLNKIDFIKATKEEIISTFSKKEVDKKVCFLSDGTIETGDKIIAELKKLGIKTFNYNGRDCSSYYYGNDEGEISVNISIPKGYTLTKLPIVKKTRKTLNVGDVIKIKPDSRYRTSCEINWRDEGWGGLISVHRKIQYIFKIVEDLIYVDDENYGGNNYLVIERENIELVESKIQEIKMKNRILTPENATKIINIACSTWKSKLAEKWATNIVLGKDTEVSEEFYVEMRKACTSEQNTLFDEIFGKDEQLIDIADLRIGESMIVCNHDRWNGTIVSRIWTDDGEDAVYVNMNNTSCTWTPNPKFKGKKVKLTITHEEVK